MRSILLFLLFSLGFANCLAQEEQPCGLESPPALLGLRLNMSPEEAQGVFGRDLKIEFKTRGEKTIFENYIDRRPPPLLAGIRALYLRFFDRRLYQIEVFYEERGDWQTLENFTARLAERLSIPPDVWKTELGKSAVVCPGFSIVAHKTLNPRIELTDEALRARVEELRKGEKN